MTKAEALARIETLRRAIESCPVRNVDDAGIDVALTGPRVVLPWDEFCGVFSRSESKYANGCQYLTAKAGGVIWKTLRTLPEGETREVLTQEESHV